MMLNIGNSGIFSNQSVGTTTIDQIEKASNSLAGSNSADNGLEMLKSMLAGDTFSGEITSINGNEVILQLNNGTSLMATLMDNANISVGKNVTFMVSEMSEGKISLKPMATNEQENILIGKALDAAGLPFTDKNINVVKELLTQNMPIDKDTIGMMMKSSLKFPDANIDTIARMVKLDIPITEENIQQFEAYKSYEHSISGELELLGENLGKLLSQTASKDGIFTAADVSKNIVTILYSNQSMEEPMGNSNGLESQKNVVTIYEPISKLSDDSQRQKLAQNLTDTLGEGAAKLSEDIKNGNISAKSVLDGMNDLMKNTVGLDIDKVKNMFESKEFVSLIKQVVRDNLRITPEDVKSEDGIKDFYKRVRENIEKLSDVVENNGKESSFSKSLGTIRNNIDFMNDLNKNMTYFQMPIKFTSNNANGELYVFTNKKSLSKDSDHVSALLHLDMENLGPVDIYVKLAGKKVSTNFCLESEEMLDFVYEHIDQLNSRLESLGYDVSFDMKVRDKDEGTIDFVEDFLDRDTRPVSTTQLMFDTKA